MNDDAMKIARVKLLSTIEPVLKDRRLKFGRCSADRFRQHAPFVKSVMTFKEHRGFSLLELMIVIAIGLTLASISFMALQPLLKQGHVDSAYDTTLGAIRSY